MYTATYSPDDNKLRLYAGGRLPPETYARVKAAGFKWAPKQDLFVAPKWSPDREDLLLELAGEIDDEDKSLCQRAEERAERFDGYSERRGAEADAARSGVETLAGGIPLGQPILIGHHSEKRARKDAERIRSGMDKAVRLWKTSQYWTDRAAGALAHAKYKELPQVRARRIKGIETDRSRVAKTLDRADAGLKLWTQVQAMPEAEATKKGTAIANCMSGYTSFCFTLAEYPRHPPASQYEGPMSLWGALDGGILTGHQAAALMIPRLTQGMGKVRRWLEHYDNRLTYEKAMLEEQGASALLEKKPRPVQLPLCNYRAPAGIVCRNPYRRGDTETYVQIEMTKAEYARINGDYRSTRDCEDSHRVRTAYVTPPTGGTRSLYSVFLTDSKVHAKPEPGAPPPPKAPRLVMEGEPRAAPAKDPRAESFKILEQQARAGVQVVTAPTLFPTPPDVAARMAQEAELDAAHRILEPSAGTGNLVRAIREDCPGVEGPRVVAVELSQALADRLRGRDEVICGDFLECEDLGTFDRVLMNPPFNDGADIKHVRHALRFLKPGGRLVGICAGGPRQETALRPLAENSGGLWEPLPDDTFKAAGTAVSSVLFTINAPEEVQP